MCSACGGGHYSHAVCQALKLLPMTCRLTSQRPEEQQNTHMRNQLPHMLSHGLMLSRRRPHPPTAPPSAPTPASPAPPGTLALPNLWIYPLDHHVHEYTHTHTHTLAHAAPPTAHSTLLIKGFASSVSRSHAGTPQSGGHCSHCQGSLASYEERKQNIKMFGS